MLWLYSEGHEKVGMLKGTEEVKITSVIPSGDKEISFNYGKNGNHRKDIKCEGYIRTKTDEYVIKDIESKEKKDTITARLNLEEIEGKVFEKGVHIVFETFEGCMQQILEGTGWEVVYCDVKKRRTIKKEEGCTALEVINQCVNTYKIEIQYDTINKKIRAYDEIGADRGRYIMENLNLRQLAVGKNTYDFCTRLIPIGKDGLTVEEVNNGKKYVENNQYSNKVKTKVWIDRRYTHAESLLEDAMIKLEEMAKPYTTYTADIADLAKQSEIYKNVLDFELGDTVTLISKTEGIIEKQRIVSMTEYPDMPEKNTCELSSVRKTFADLQKEESEEMYDAISDTGTETEGSANDFATKLFETLSDDVDDVGKRITTMEETVKGLQDNTQIGEMSQTLQEIQTSIEAINTKNESQDTKIGTIETDIETLKTNTEGLQDLKDTVKGISDSLIEIRRVVTETATATSEMKEEVKKLKDKISELHPDPEPPTNPDPNTGTEAGTGESTGTDTGTGEGTGTGIETGTGTGTGTETGTDAGAGEGNETNGETGTGEGTAVTEPDQTT